MRKKSEAKRDEILDVAAQLFREQGFERTSMVEISARVGGSKATIYNYFPSKEELFFEVMFRTTGAEFEAIHQALCADCDDPEAALRQFGRRFLALLYSPKVQAARRLMVAESGRSELGQLCYARGPAKGIALISDFLGRAMRGGRLRRADPQVAAKHLLALLGAELSDQCLFQIVESVSAARIRAVVDRALGVFMAAYGLARA